MAWHKIVICAVMRLDITLSLVSIYLVVNVSRLFSVVTEYVMRFTICRFPSRGEEFLGKATKSGETYRLLWKVCCAKRADFIGARVLLVVIYYCPGTR